MQQNSAVLLLPAEPTTGNGANYDHYSFVQTLKDANATFPMPKGTRARDCDVQLTSTSLRVGLKGQAPIVDGPLFESIKVSDSGWSLADDNLDVLLTKENKQQWWKTIIKGDPEINTQKVRRYCPPNPSIVLTCLLASTCSASAAAAHCSTGLCGRDAMLRPCSSTA